MSEPIVKIESILKSEYSAQNYLDFIVEIFDSMKTVAPFKVNKEFSNFSSHIEGYIHVGNYTTPENKKIAILSVQLKSGTYVENARSTQRSYARKLIDNGNCDAAMIAFYTPNEGKNVSEYRALHVDVAQSYAEIEEEINCHVHTIQSCIVSQKSNGCFTAWRDVFPDEYFANKDTVSIDSDIGFRTISETCNTLFATEYKGSIQQSWFVPSTFRKKYGQQYKVWFPKLAVENKAVIGNWHNELSQDGNRIIEFNESSQWTAEDERTDLNELRVTFAHVLDPITRNKEYRFVGVFKYSGIEQNKNIYTRINESFPLVKL